VNRRAEFVAELARVAGLDPEQAELVAIVALRLLSREASACACALDRSAPELAMGARSVAARLQLLEDLQARGTQDLATMRARRAMRQRLDDDDPWRGARDERRRRQRL
jgi:hypothetical protein